MVPVGDSDGGASDGGGDGHVVGFIDIGTNSVRLMLVRISATALRTR